MKKEFLDALRNLASKDPNKTPTCITMKALHEELTSRVFSGEEASRVIGRTTVNVNDEFVKDVEYLNEAVKCFIQTIVNMKSFCDSIEPNLFWEVIKQQGFVLECNL
jgi:hypothetical protein